MDEMLLNNNEAMNEDTLQLTQMNLADSQY